MVGCILGCSCSYPTNVKLAFVQLAASFGIKFMETSAKANINIENVSTATFLLFVIVSANKQQESLLILIVCKTQLSDASDVLLNTCPCIL